MPAYRDLLDSGTDAGLTPHDAELLQQVVQQRRPANCLEVGMANGVSSLVILENLPEGGRLTSIDPNQPTDWAGAGLRNIAAAGFADQHRLIDAPDYLALPQLLESGERFDLVFIDGWHSFEYVLLDLFYADLLLRPGGVMGFDDCEMAATRKALRFLTSHRPYTELTLRPPRYRASNPLKTLLRFALRWSVQDRWFEKLRDEQTPWNFYRRF